MDTTVLVLFSVGVVLLGFEVIVPGAILGLAAALFFLAGVIAAYVQDGPGAATLAGAVALALIAALLYLEFRVLPRTAWGRKMFLNHSIDGASQAPVAEAASVVGREARALTALGPSGFVEVEGRRYAARCLSGFAEAGATLTVVRVESFELLVSVSG
jgi:membrane-bound ClpP family serine protease